MTIQLDLTSLITLAIALIGAFWVLFRLLLSVYAKSQEEAISRLEDNIDRLAKEHTALSDKQTKLSEKVALDHQALEYSKKSIQDLESSCEKMSDELGDAQGTIMGFGRDFVTRKEYTESHEYRTREKKS